jgi:hypothetical protein
MASGDGTTLAARLAQRLTARASAEQVSQLAAVLALAVRGLSRRRMQRPGLRRLGARDGVCRAVAQDAAFPAALQESLEEVLGGALPTPVREAWSACHRMLASLIGDGSGKVLCCPA